MRLPQRWSIAKKLTIHYTLVSSFILLLISIALTYTITHLFSTAEKQYLIDEHSIIESTLKQHPNNLEAIRQEVMGVPAALKNSSYYYYIRILNEKNKILMQTPDTDKNIKGADFNTKSNPSSEKKDESSHFQKWISNEGKPFLLMTSPIEHDQNGKTTKRMEMALDISYPQNIIAKTSYYILVFFILFVLIFLTLGKWVAKKGLKSICEMIEITKRITAHKLSQRLNHEDWPHELKDLGSSFNKMISGIENTFHRLNECSNELAHELRIPINNLIGSTEIILSRDREKEDYKELLASNLEEFRRLSKLTEDILFLARSESPDCCIKLSTIQLHDELQKFCEYYKYIASEKNITLTAEGNAIIHADPLLLHRALMNLMNNAIKYTPSNGTISLRIKESKEYVELQIADTGIGISNDQLGQIFERFYKGKQIDACVQSFGLGLPIVKSIMQLHKGYVTVLSKLTKGSTFVLYFPK